jgi:hypothetical protein
LRLSRSHVKTFIPEEVKSRILSLLPNHYYVVMADAMCVLNWIIKLSSKDIISWGNYSNGTNFEINYKNGTNFEIYEGPPDSQQVRD